MEYLENLLAELRLELTALFEQGLAQSGSREASLRELGQKLSACGLAEGAGLIDNLCGELAQSRLDAAWQPGGAALHYSRLWRYTDLCRRRLEFLETRANLREQAPGT